MEKKNKYYIILPVKFKHEGKTEHLNYFIDAPSGRELQQFLDNQDLISFFKLEHLRQAIETPKAHVYRHVSYGAVSDDLSEENWEKAKRESTYRGVKTALWGIQGDF